MSRVTLNAGDTFVANCTYRDATGALVALDLAGFTVTAEARAVEGGAVLPVEVVLANQSSSPGRFKLRSQTDAWRSKSHSRSWLVVIRYTTAAGDKFSSRPIEVELR